MLGIWWCWEIIVNILGDGTEIIYGWRNNMSWTCFRTMWGNEWMEMYMSHNWPWIGLTGTLCMDSLYSSVFVLCVLNTSVKIWLVLNQQER